MTSWTLQDLRRLVQTPNLFISVNIPPYRRSMNVLKQAHPYSSKSLLVEGKIVPFTGPEIDRLISKLGAHWPQRPEKKSRPKDTEKTAPVSPDESVEDAVHGGDGASGEVPVPDASAGGPSDGIAPGSQRTSSEEPCGQDGHPISGTGTTPGSAPSSADQGSGSRHASEEVAYLAGDFFSGEDPLSEKADVPCSPKNKNPTSTTTHDKPRSRGGDNTLEHPRSDTLRLLEKAAEEVASTYVGSPHATLRRSVRAHARKLEKSLDSSYEGIPTRILFNFAAKTGCCHASWAHALMVFQKEHLSQGEAVPSLARAPRTWGGDFSYFESPEGGDPRLTQRIAREIRHLVTREMGQFGETSPRIHGARLITEICGRSLRSARWKKRESEPRIAILAVDVSGSCSSYCPELSQAAQAIADLDPRIAIVFHSNGIPSSIYGTPTLRWKVPSRVYGTEPETDDWGVYTRHCEFLVVFGDHDAESVYRDIAEQGTKVFWFHNYLASGGAALPSKKLQNAITWHPSALIQGIGSASDILRGFSMIRDQTSLPHSTL